MKEEIENIDGFFRDELKNYSPELPMGAWDNIAAKLASQNAPKRVIPLFWKVAASVALFLGTTALGLYLINNKPQQNIAALDYTLPVEKSVPLQKPIDHSNKQKNVRSSQEDISVLAYSNKLVVDKETENKTVLPNPEATDLVDDNNPSGDLIESSNDNFAVTGSEELVANDNEQASDETEIKGENNGIPTLKEMPDQKTQNLKWQTSDDAVNDSKPEGQWFIGGQGGPQYTFRTVSTGNESFQDNSYDISANNSNIEEYGTIAYAAGIHIEYKPARRFSVQSGIYYSKYSINSKAAVSFANSNPARLPELDGMAYQVSSSDVVVRFPNNSVTIVSKSENSIDGQKINTINNNAGDYEAALINTTDINNTPSTSTNYEYIEIPVIARYALLDKRFNLQLLGGLSTNLLIKNYTQVDLPSEYNTEFETQSTNTLNYSSTLGIGFGYDINSKITMSVEPQFKYFLGSQVYDANNVRPYSLGVYSGVKYRF